MCLAGGGVCEDEDGEDGEKQGAIFRLAVDEFGESHEVRWEIEKFFFD